jgi:phosphoribosylanthranilate isomerase
MMVKICGITNRDDALAAVDAGAAALGFNFCSASPRFISPPAAAAIIAALPPAIWKAGVFADERPETVLGIARETGLDIAQLHGCETVETYPKGIRIWKAIRVKAGSGALEGLLDCPAEAVLLDGPASGQSFDWARVPQAPIRVIVAGGLHAGNVRQAIEQARPWGVDACSQLESTPGRKDHLKMAGFVKAALAAS